MKLRDVFGGNPPKKPQTILATSDQEADAIKQKIKEFDPDARIEEVNMGPEDFGIDPAKFGGNLARAVADVLKQPDVELRLRSKLEAAGVPAHQLRDAVEQTMKSLQKLAVPRFTAYNRMAVMGHKTLHEGGAAIEVAMKAAAVNTKPPHAPSWRELFDMAVTLSRADRDVSAAAIEGGVDDELPAKLLTFGYEIASITIHYMLGTLKEPLPEVVRRLAMLQCGALSMDDIDFQTFTEKPWKFFQHNWPLVKEGKVDFEDFRKEISRLEQEEKAELKVDLAAICPCATCVSKRAQRSTPAPEPTPPAA
jgi:hypothetical protein